MSTKPRVRYHREYGWVPRDPGSYPWTHWVYEFCIRMDHLNKRRLPYGGMKGGVSL